MSIIAIATLTVVTVGVYWIFLEFRQFRNDSDNLRASFVERQKQNIKKEVESTIDYIEYNRSLSQEHIKKDLKLRVDEAWEIANNIYNENKASKSETEIAKMVKDALRPIRFNNGRGDIFIYTTEGVSVMLPRSRAFENRLSIDLRDSLGNYLVRREIQLLKNADRGYLTYNAPVDSQLIDSVIFKFTYIRKFAPFNWYFGSKDYLKDFEEDLKKELLARLSNIRYSYEGYIFINTLDGKALVTNGIKPDQPIDIFTGNDTNWINVYRQQVKVAREKGSGFLNYNFRRLASNDFENKFSYISLVKNWGWIVGAGFYENEVEAEIAGKQQEMKTRIQDFITRIVLSLLAVIVIIALFARFVTSKIEHSFAKFTGFFRDSSLESSLIDIEQLSFAEFRTLGKSVNNTVLERNHAQIALVKEEALLRSLIDSTPDLVFFKDLKSNYIGCNTAFANFIGINEKDILGKSDFDLFPKDAAEAYYAADLKIFEDHIPIRNEEWNLFPDGSRKLLDTFKVIYSDKNGNVLGIMAISRDITERAEIQQQFKDAKEKAEEADRLKTAFLANMSHEIRTPMNSIIGFSSLLTDESLSSVDKAEYIQHINNSGETLLNLIDDIIDISKIEAGQLTVFIEQCNLDELIADLYATFTEVLKHKQKTGVKLVFEPGQLSDGIVIMTDPSRLKQVISNLIGNAVKFTPKGSITYGYRQEGEQILFYVRDTGIGISENDQKVIFKRFRQAKETGVRHKGGTGLGLAISQHIIGLLGGSIWVESSPGNGSIFYFTIPYKSVGQKLHTEAVKSTEKPLLYDWSSKTLLIVEAVDSNFNYLNAALSRTGINLLRATDGLSGIDLCKNNGAIDMVFMDVNMPGMSGYDATKEIKRIRPALPVIAQTYGVLLIEAEHYREAGCDEYVSKPVKFNILMDILSKYLKNHQS